MSTGFSGPREGVTLLYATSQFTTDWRGPVWSARSLCEVVSECANRVGRASARNIGKAIREGETGRVHGPFSVVRSRSQGSRRRGKSLKCPPLSTCEAEIVSPVDRVVGVQGVEPRTRDYGDTAGSPKPGESLPSTARGFKLHPRIPSPSSDHLRCTTYSCPRRRYVEAEIDALDCIP